MTEQKRRRTHEAANVEVVGNPSGAKSSSGAAKPSSADAFADEAESLRHALSVQLHRLHEQCAEQPELYRRATELYAEARAAASRAKLREDEIKAQTSLAARAYPGNYGLDKVTETSIAAAVTENEQVKKAERETIAAQRLADDMRGLMSAYEQRKSMLDTEARLYLGNYWGAEGAAFGATNATEDAIARKRRGE